MAQCRAFQTWISLGDTHERVDLCESTQTHNMGTQRDSNCLGGGNVKAHTVIHLRAMQNSVVKSTHTGTHTHMRQTHSDSHTCDRLARTHTRDRLARTHTRDRLARTHTHATDSHGLTHTTDSHGLTQTYLKGPPLATL